jgi:vitamin B12 transporter
MKLSVLELAMCTAVSTLLFAPPLRAQDAAAAASSSDAGVAEPPPAAPVLVAPEPLTLESAAYPEAARAQRIEGSVVLRLSIDASGAVTEAEVTEPLGHGFDESAREALLRSRFSPAMRDRQAMPARIAYRYVFALPPEPEPAPVTAPAPTVPTAPPPKPAEVQVRGTLSEQEELEQSAESVMVFDAKRARRESSELGEVLSRLPGVSIRRAGGLGSDERMSLNGMADDRVPTFLDGVPLELTFFPFGVAAFPVSLVDRVEIYKGVVPIRFGSDALGGAVNLVSDRRYESGVGASYEVGSFGTHRMTGNAAHRHDGSGFVVNGMGFYDYSDNDFEIDVEVPNEVGRPMPARVKRFHDAYEAGGATVELGFVEKPWAKRALLRVYSVALHKEIQHNLVMSVPYGEPTYEQTASGATARYEQALSHQLDLELIGSYSYRTATFVDKSQWVYNWFGERVRERLVFGELEADPTDQVYRWHNALGRVVLEYAFTPQHVATLASSPTWTTLTGDERIPSNPTARDPLTAERVRISAVTGLELESNFFEMPDAPAEDEGRRAGTDYRLQNLLFAKYYLYMVDGEDPLPGGLLREVDTDSHTIGIGDGVRYRFTRWLLAKASYEYATRLPRPDEVFGDGILIHQNLELKPEVSHNLNAGPVIDVNKTWSGDYNLEVMGFFRQADNLIMVLGADRYFTYQNVWEGRSMGVDVSSTWISPDRYVTLDGNLSLQDFRNTSDEGTFGEYKGDRLPNRPWLFGSWGARLHFDKVLLEGDELEPFYVGRYVHEYFRGWESLGRREFKQVVDSQLSHTVGVTYVMELEPVLLAATLEVQNLGDAKVYDFYGVQRPGRAYFLKLTGDFR